jgi:hypothetical protein
MLWTGLFLFEKNICTNKNHTIFVNAEGTI